MKHMKLLALSIVLLLSCETDVDRWTTHTYYIENISGNTIRLIGYTTPTITVPNVDTLVDEIVPNGESLIIVSGYGIGGPTFESIGAESCDTMKIFKDTVLILKSWNFLKTSANVNDSTEKFYQFHNTQVYVPYDTTFFDSNGPQPKEIKYKFQIE